MRGLPASQSASRGQPRLERDRELRDDGDDDDDDDERRDMQRTVRGEPETKNAKRSIAKSHNRYASKAIHRATSVPRFIDRDLSLCMSVCLSVYLSAS